MTTINELFREENNPTEENGRLDGRREKEKMKHSGVPDAMHVEVDGRVT